jgi:hypothetical protein
VTPSPPADGFTGSEPSASGTRCAARAAFGGGGHLRRGITRDPRLPPSPSLTANSRHSDRAKALDLPAGSVVVFDRGYIDYGFCTRLAFCIDYATDFE